MRLVFCDGNRILCESLAAALESRGHRVLAIATTATEAIVVAARYRPDICVVDLCLPDPDKGIEAVRTIRRRCLVTKVLILSRLTDPAACATVREMGVAGMLRKDHDVVQIADALDAIAGGGRVFDPGLRAPGRSPVRPGGRTYFLTGREQEVLRRLLNGQSTSQMAREMNIAISTLRTYVKNVLSKLGAHSRLEAAAVASREGLLEDISAA